MPRTRTAALAALIVFLAATACAPNPPYRAIDLAELRDAEGWYHLPDFRYQGAIRDGQPDGEGVALYPSGVRVQSRFVNGVAQGEARVLIPEVGTYVGEMRAGRLVRGEVTYVSGDYYRGDLAEWRPEGTGVLVRADDRRYSGAFRGGQPNGKGVSYDPRSRRLTEGSFANGQPDGRAFVLDAGAPSVQDYQRGTDVTESVVLARTSELALGPVDKQVAEARARAEQAQLDLNESGTELRRLENLRTAGGVEQFNKACFCIRKASVQPDGSVHVGSDGCLTVRDSNQPLPTPEQERLAEEREDARRRTCLDWAKDIGDPDMPARIAATGAMFDRRSAALDAAVNARRQAEADRARLATELQARERSARVRAIAQQVAAARAAEAKAADERRKKQCAGSTSNCCYCAIVNGGRAAAASCAPCQ